MELLQLKYFQTIAKTEHISKAAETLHIAQPSLSQTLKRLEAEIGVQLFDRVGKNIILNDAGKIFLKYVNEIFSSMDNALLELKTHQGIEDKSVTIFVQSASLILTNLLKEIKKVDDSINFKIFQNTSVDALENGDLLISSSYEKPSNVSSKILLEESLVIALPKTHILANKQNIELQDLYNESFLSLSPNSNLFEIISHYCSQKNFEPKISTFVDTPSIMRDLLNLNLGIAFIPEVSWKDFFSESIVIRKLSDFNMTRYITLSWNENKYLTPSVLLCKDIIISYFTKYNLLK
ncbi:LysR family transcriptional regulator [Clostridioides difficile]